LLSHPYVIVLLSSSRIVWYQQKVHDKQVTQVDRKTAVPPASVWELCFHT